MDDVERWNMVECDIDILRKLIKFYGGPGVEIEELWNLDYKQFEELRPVHGLMLLFKWEPGGPMSGAMLDDEERFQKIFFAKQIMNNGCITQAMVHVLLNSSHPDIKLSEALRNFKEFCCNFDPDIKGLLLSNLSSVRNTHNSFSMSSYFTFSEADMAKGKNVFHFVTYLPIGGYLYELDGLKEGPVDLGRIPPNADWLRLIKPIVDSRVHRYQEHDVNYNLLAVVSDGKVKYEQQINEIEVQLNKDPIYSVDLVDDLEYLHALIEEENMKQEHYSKENMRRKHNYLPLLTEMIKMMGYEKMFLPLCEETDPMSLFEDSFLKY